MHMMLRNVGKSYNTDLTMMTDVQDEESALTHVILSCASVQVDIIKHV